MKTRTILLNLAVSLLCFCVTSRAGAQLSVSGWVFSDNAKFAEGAEIASVWLLGTPDHDGARAYRAVSTDNRGRFTLAVSADSSPYLLVYSSDRTQAATVQLQSGQSSLDINLRPVTQVHIQASAPRLGTDLRSTRFLLAASSGATLGQLLGNEVTFPCPQGDYQLSLSSSETTEKKVPVHVRSTESLALRVHLGLSPLAERYGRRPLSLAGLVDEDGAKVLLPQFDRPTLIYFWADWCEPCIAEGIPHLLQFVQKHKGERFQILAVHENGIPTLTRVESYKRSIAHLQNAVWHQKLSFPSTFDSSGSVTSRWGLSTFPT